MATSTYFIGVDVGTGSARAALVSDVGKIVKVAVEDIQTWNPQQDFYEQSSNNIWNSCVTCVKKVTVGVDARTIKGIGFDATCSLVVLDTQGNPLSVSPTGNTEQNVILWMDHRASIEADKINGTKHRILQYVGGKISLEMEMPKLLWLKSNMPDCWERAGLFFDLPDFLTWKATSCESRSLCSLVCKWSCEVLPEGMVHWNESYFKLIGLEDLLQQDCHKIGSTILSPGTPVGNGLSEIAAKELGLPVGLPVGTSLIDAHAGGLGLIGCSGDNIDSDFKTRLSLICGTSTCHMAVSPAPIFVPGVWGPYYGAMVPNMWLLEGGQSATGKLLDHIIETHPATKNIRTKIGTRHIQHYLLESLEKLAKEQNLKAIAYLTNDLHVWPDFHGNRSPIADPSLRGSICGLTLASDEENLAILYLATIQAISYGTRHILETLGDSGILGIKSICLCGGLGKNSLFTQTQSDVTDLPIICPDEIESVLLGSAILGACAAKHFDDIPTAIKSMGGKGKVIKPNAETLQYHNKKYKVFLKMLNDQLEYRKIMNS